MSLVRISNKAIGWQHNVAKIRAFPCGADFLICQEKPEFAGWEICATLNLAALSWQPIATIVVLVLVLAGCSNQDDRLAARRHEREREQLSLACGAQFYARPDGYKVLEEAYGFRIPRDCIIRMTDGLTYKALAVGAVDVAMGFATDGRIAAFDLVNLNDDKGFFPVYNPAPVTRTDIIERYPELSKILEETMEKIDTTTMTSLNKRVDVDHLEPERAARDWIAQAGLEPSQSPPVKKGSVIVSSKSFTEQLILGNILRLVLEAHGFEVSPKLGLAGELNRRLLLSGEVDLYMEYTGTALIVYLKHEEPITDPKLCYETVKEEDLERNGLVWLSPCPLNNTYTLMMRSARAKELDIASISDLAQRLQNH